MRRPSATVLGFLIVLLAITIVLAQIRPDPPRADELASPGHPGWSVDIHNGCWVWNSNPQPGTTVAWSGTCALNGRARGRGIVEWHWEDDGKSKLARYDGEYLDGRRSGHGAYMDDSGNSYEGNGETIGVMAGVSSRMERASATTASFEMAKSTAEAL